MIPLKQLQPPVNTVIDDIVIYNGLALSKQVAQDSHMLQYVARAKLVT